MRDFNEIMKDVKKDRERILKRKEKKNMSLADPPDGVLYRSKNGKYKKLKKRVKKLEEENRNLKDRIWKIELELEMFTGKGE